MVDTTVLEAVALRCESSSLSPGTKENKEISSEKMGFFICFVYVDARGLEAAATPMTKELGEVCLKWHTSSQGVPGTGQVSLRAPKHNIAFLATIGILCTSFFYVYCQQIFDKGGVDG